MSSSESHRFPINDSGWEDHKIRIRNYYLEENKTLDELIDIMKRCHGFTYGKSKFREKLKEWGCNKNRTRRNQGNVTHVPGQHPRRRRNKARPNVDHAFGSPRKAFAIRKGSREELNRILVEIIGRCFQSNGSAWTATSTSFASAPPISVTDAVDPWKQLLLECQNAVVLSQIGRQRMLLFSLHTFFRRIFTLAKNMSPWFLVYFWEITLMLRSMRTRGAQKAEKNNYTLLSYYLRLLKIVFSPPHPFSNILAWFNNILDEANRLRETSAATEIHADFKDSLDWGYFRTINCLQKEVKGIGEAHPVILYMTVQHASKFLIGATRGQIERDINSSGSRGFRSTTYQRESIRQKYREKLNPSDLSTITNLSQEGRSEYKVSLMLMSMLSATVGNKVDDVASARQSAASLFDESLECCTLNIERLVQTSVYPQALYHSTSWLANRMFEERNMECFIMMDKAIEVLRKGDTGCCIWAFSLSKRLYMWYKVERRKKRERFLRECERQQQISLTIPQAHVVRGPNLSGVRGKERVKLLRQRAKAEKASLFEATRHLPVRGGST